MSFAMFSIILILFIFKCVESQDKPTKESICDDSRFDASVVLTNTGADGSPVYKRYLFKGNFVLPYIRNETIETIDWPNIQLITDVFKGLKGIKADNKTATMAYELDGRLFIRYGDAQKIYELDKQKDFQMIKTHKRFSLLGFEYLAWFIYTRGKVVASPLFFDANVKAFSRPEKHKKFNLTYPGGNFTVYLFNDTDKERILESDSLIPLILLYKQNRIPVDYNHYYTTKTMETIYFRGKSVCVSQLWSPKRWHVSNYCRSFVSTRSIIGCDEKSTKQENPVNSVPESDPNEPEEDIAPDV